MTEGTPVSFPRGSTFFRHGRPIKQTRRQSNTRTLAEVSRFSAIRRTCFPKNFCAAEIRVNDLTSARDEKQVTRPATFTPAIVAET